MFRLVLGGGGELGWKFVVDKSGVERAWGCSLS